MKRRVKRKKKVKGKWRIARKFILGIYKKNLKYFFKETPLKCFSKKHFKCFFKIFTSIFQNIVKLFFFLS